MTISYSELKNTYSSYSSFLNNTTSYSNFSDRPPSSYSLGIVRDNPIGFWTLDDLDGTNFIDYSGCNNSAEYSSSYVNTSLPLISGNSVSAKITDSLSISYDLSNNFYNKAVSSTIGTKYSSGTEFSIECWLYPASVSSSEFPVVGDSTNSVGIFYENGNITFKLNSHSLSYSLMNFSRVVHVVGVYSVNYMHLFVDGVLVNSNKIDSFEFENTELSLSTGPAQSGEYFYMNNIAVYSYSLPANKILGHYNLGYGITPSQIVYPNGGELFQIFDNSPSYEFKYSYPGNKSWLELTTEDTYVDRSENSLSLIPTNSSEEKTVVIDDYISIPVSYQMDSSKIEWEATNGVSVYASIDGENFVECKNNLPIPGYTISDFSTSNQVYIKIYMTTSNASKFVPRIKSLIIKFYNNQILYSNNGSSYLSSLEGISGQSAFDLGFGNKYYTVLSREKNNGIKIAQDSGFFLNSNKAISGIEFFYTPSEQSNSGLINVLAVNGYSAATYRWHNSGSITKSNIDYILVNGVDQTAETSAYDIFNAKELHHVFIKFVSPVSGLIKFADSTYGCPESIFQNIAIYESEIDQPEALNNFNLYRYPQASYVLDSSLSSISMTENSANYYNHDWNVLLSS